jgi:hypothetical protein
MSPWLLVGDGKLDLQRGNGRLVFVGIEIFDPSPE